MEGFVKGDIVVLPFPFSDLSRLKRRPAVVVANLIGDDLILCQITSETRKDGYSIVLTDDDFNDGCLEKISNIRPNKLFTADKSIIVYKVGSLKDSKRKEVEDQIINMFRQ